jgi:hypothetical protein
MKKLLLLFSIFVNAQLLKSQSWCPPGAVWNYYVNGIIAGIDGIMEFKYTGNTTINGISCKTIEGTFRGWKFGLSYLGNNTIVPNLRAYYTYENNKVVYLHNGVGFDTVVNFNASIGDRWLELLHPSFVICDNSRTFYQVTDTGHVWLNNQYLKKITVSYNLLDKNGIAFYPVAGSNIFIEKVMFQGSSSHDNYIDLFNYICYEKDMIRESPSLFLICYKDDNFPLFQQGNRECNDLTGIQSRGIQNSTTQIYPNPTNNFLNVNFQNISSIDDYEIKLSDFLGRASTPLSATTKTGKEIDLSTFPKGIYFLQIWDKGKLLACEKVIKQ